MAQFIRIIFGSMLMVSYQFSYSQKVDIGLISQLELTDFKKVERVSKSDIVLHEKIDSIASTKSYLSKSLVNHREKILVSIHTQLSIEEYLKPIKKNKSKFTQVNFWVYKGVHFVSLEFKLANKKINRIIYQEPNLTTIVILDLFQDLNERNSKSLQLIKGLSYRTSA